MLIGKIRVTNIQETANGDYLYELAMSTETKNEITVCAAELGLTAEAYLRWIILEAIPRGMVKVNGSWRDL